MPRPYLEEETFPGPLICSTRLKQGFIYVYTKHINNYELIINNVHNSPNFLNHCVKNVTSFCDILSLECFYLFLEKATSGKRPTKSSKLLAKNGDSMLKVKG